MNQGRKLRIMVGFVVLFLVAFLTGCFNSNPPQNNKYKITVSLSNGTGFEGHNVWLELYDSNTNDGSGNPTGLRLGWGVISVDFSGGGSGIIRNPIDQSDLTLDSGDYYLYCIADLDNSINTMVGNGIGRTPGDQYTDIITVTVNGNTTKPITAADFINNQP